MLTLPLSMHQLQATQEATEQSRKWAAEESMKEATNEGQSWAPTDVESSDEEAIKAASAEPDQHAKDLRLWNIALKKALPQKKAEDTKTALGDLVDKRLQHQRVDNRRAKRWMALSKALANDPKLRGEKKSRQRQAQNCPTPVA